MLKYLKIKNNLVHRTAIINWKKVKIGKNNVVGPYVVIGNHPQWPKKKTNGHIYIGNNNFFNEYCNVHLPTNLTKKTIIGNHNYFMNSTTIDHDCIIGDNCHVSPGVILCGGVSVGSCVYVGAGSSVLQEISIGANSIVASGSVVYKNIDENVTFIQSKYEINK